MASHTHFIPCARIGQIIVTVRDIVYIQSVGYNGTITEIVKGSNCKLTYATIIHYSSTISPKVAECIVTLVSGDGVLFNGNQPPNHSQPVNDNDN